MTPLRTTLETLRDSADLLHNQVFEMTAGIEQAEDIDSRFLNEAWNAEDAALTTVAAIEAMLTMLESAHG
jgi:hypothetical protein